MTLISVIIPCYNSADTISFSLDSILNQNYQTDFEVIICDDHSNDINELKLIVQKYQHKFKKIILLESNKNLGGGAARNKGIDVASGDYICFLDSDDIWYENKISEQMKEYISGSILIGRVRKGTSNEESIILPTTVKDDEESISDALFLTNKLMQTSTFFMDSAIAKLVKFNPSLPRHQDYDFLLRAESLGINIIQSKSIVSFWFIPDNTSKRFLKKKASPEFFIRWYKEYNIYFSKKSKLAYVYKNIFSACMITKKYSLFLKFLNSNYFSHKDRFNIFFNIIIWRIKRLLNEK